MNRTAAIIDATGKMESALSFLPGETGFAFRSFSTPAEFVSALNGKSINAADLSLVMVHLSPEAADPARERACLRFLEKMSAHSRLSSVPRIILGKEEDDMRASCDGLCAAYLAMPVRRRVLLDAIHLLCPGACAPDGEGSEPVKYGQSAPSVQDYPETPRSEPSPAAITITHKPPNTGSEPLKNDISPAESERRLATIMFADISGFTAMSEKMDPEEVTGVMNGCFKMMERIISSRGGHIDKFIGDCVMVLFGVPKAIENAPLQAINTAIEMRNGLYQFNREKNLAIPLDIHIGMNTGPVVAGHVGGDNRKDFTVMGDAVNLASRIEGASEKGQILVGPDTWHATQDDYEFRVLPPVSLKGKTEPVPVYEVLSVKEAAPRRHATERRKTGPERMIYSELVGRDREMNELRHLVTGLIKGRGGIVNVIGEAGIGKSRLMAELKSDPAMKQVIVLEGQAISMGRNLSFHPIIDLLKHWAGISEEDNEQMSFAKLDRAIRGVHPDEADEILPFVATLMGMKLSEKYAERVKGIAGEALEKLIFKNIRELLIKGSELRPMILRIEDLHWADTSSIELLSALFRLAQNHRILFLNFFRPNYEETGDQVVKTAKEEFAEITTEIIIQPLDGNESATLISNLLNIKGLPQSLKDQITERAGGNPFFIEEVVRSLIDEGAVMKKGDVFVVTEKISTVTVPLTINEVLMSRIDRLDEETKNLIKTASVIGRYFFHKIIAQVARNISDMDRRLGYLEDIQLIRERKRLDELEYLFKHALAQEAAYESLLIQKRKELHLHVAQAIERVFAGRLPEFYGTLAYHYSRGENLDKTEEYMLKAGEEAMRTSASSEALAFYQEVLKLYIAKFGDRVDPAKAAMMEKNIAIALHRKGHFEALAYVNRVLAFRGVREYGTAALFIRAMGSFIILMKNMYVHFKMSKRTFTGMDEEIFEFMQIKNSIVFNHDPLRYFLMQLEYIRVLVKYDLSKMYNAAFWFGGLSVGFIWAGMPGVGREILKFMDTTGMMEADYSEPSPGLAHLLLCFMNGEEMDAFDPKQYDRFIKKGNFHTAITVFYFVGCIELEKGNRGAFEEQRQRLHQIADNYDQFWTRAHEYDLNTRALWKYRKLPEMLKEADVTINLWLKLNAMVVVMHIAGYKAMAQILSGDLTGAGETLDYLSGIASKEKIIPPKYLMANLFAEMLYHMHFIEEAVKNSNKPPRNVRARAAKTGRKMVSNSRMLVYDRIEAYRLMGSFCWLTGKPKKASRWWKKSIAEGERLGAILELSRTYFEVGKRTLAGTTPSPALPLAKGEVAEGRRGSVKKLIGLTPEECLAKAETMFKEMDLQWDLAELEKIKSGIKS